MTREEWLEHNKTTTEELLKKAHAGDDYAQFKIVNNLIFEPDMETVKEKLKEFAYQGWEAAQRFYCNGLAFSKNGIEQDIGKLKEFAHLGWESAQEIYCRCLADGYYCIMQDPFELKKLADLGWKSAQHFYCAGLANGYYGIEKNPDLSKELKTLWNVK